MYRFELLWIGLLLLLSPGKDRWVITDASNLVVNGSTNINKFSCEIPSYDRLDTLTITRNGKGALLSGNVGLNVQSFDCQNSMMTRDLRKTLHQKEYPRLFIQFLSLNELPGLTAKAQSVTGLVDIQLAGVTRRLEVSYQISADADRTIHLLGFKTIKFTDFKLVPPSKLGGMIKTNDELTVTFHLRIRAI
jgi:hypothetical protein